MSFIEVETLHGLVDFHYMIATPLSTMSNILDPYLPTVLLLHPEYVPMEIFHTQLLDPGIRRFNLVAVDLPGYGETKGSIPKKYGQEEMANDILRFMDALQIPPCFICGISLGTMIAIQLAVTNTSRIHGLFLISPLGTEEPPDVAQGRQEIFDCWSAAIRGKDQEAFKDAIFGSMQLCVNNMDDTLVNALGKFTGVQTRRNWGVDALDLCYRVTIKLLTTRKSYSKEALAQLRQCPIHLVYGTVNVAYSEEYFHVFHQQLREANVAVDMTSVEGAPHFVTATTKHATIVNPMLENFIMKHWKGKNVAPARTRTEISSPFDDVLLAGGWIRDEESD